MSPTEYQQRLQPLLNLSKLQEITSEEIIKEETNLKNLKEQDFLDGDIYGDDKTLLSYRSKGYEIFKSKLNPIAGGAVDLILSGRFVDAMFLLKPTNGKYLFGNLDSKKQVLTQKYGINIFGLNQKVFTKFQIDIIKPRFIRKLKESAKIQ